MRDFRQHSVLQVNFTVLQSAGNCVNVFGHRLVTGQQTRRRGVGRSHGIGRMAWGGDYAHAVDACRDMMLETGRHAIPALALMAFQPPALWKVDLPLELNTRGISSEWSFVFVIPYLHARAVGRSAPSRSLHHLDQ
jgi:hypothetical protein